MYLCSKLTFVCSMDVLGSCNPENGIARFESQCRVVPIQVIKRSSKVAYVLKSGVVVSYMSSKSIHVFLIKFVVIPN